MSVPRKKDESGMEKPAQKCGPGADSSQDEGIEREETQELNFQESLKQLEQIVDRLESGELSLEESLAQFEKGVRLARRLQSILNRAERRVQEILNSDNAVEENNHCENGEAKE